MKTRLKWACFIALWASTVALADNTDQAFEKRKKIPPPVTGGYSFKMYATPKSTGTEVLVEEGALYISPKSLTEAQVAEANDHKYGLVHLDDWAYNEHVINTCFAMVQRGLEPSHAPGDDVRLIWLGGNKTKAFMRIFTWADWWENWVITKSHGKIAIEDTNSDQGWGWRSSRVVAETDPSINLETCLGYVVAHKQVTQIHEQPAASLSTHASKSGG